METVRQGPRPPVGTPPAPRLGNPGPEENPLIAAIVYLAFGLGSLYFARLAWLKYKHQKQALVGVAGHAQLGRGGLGKLGDAPGKTESFYDVFQRTHGVLKRYEKKEGNVPIAARADMIVKFIQEGSEDPRIVEAARGILTRKCGGKWCVDPKDYRGESDALFQATVDPASPYAVRYTLDHPVVDQYTAAPKTMALRGEDCLPEGTRLLSTDGFIPIELVKPGDAVMGRTGWTIVGGWKAAGFQTTRAFHLSTGSVLRCTDNHRLFVQTETGVVEKRAHEIVEGEALLMPEEPFPAGRESLDGEYAWFLGVFVADGWVVRDASVKGSPTRVGIAGKDGHPKEAQKRRVEALAKARGWKSTWHERYIDVWPDEGTMTLLLECGHGAPNKKLPSIDFDVKTTRAVLEGLQADSGVHKGSRVYSTTSEILALQIRALHRRLGERVNIRRVDEHGGFGENPIYRISLIRANHHQRANRLALVTEIVESDIAVRTYDIETLDKSFYLPEHDVFVHNCDGLVVYLGSLLAAVGHRPEIVLMQAKGASDWSHILLREPIGASDGISAAGTGQYRYLDASMQGSYGWKPAGWEPPGLDRALRGEGPSGITVKAKALPVFK